MFQKYSRRKKIRMETKERIKELIDNFYKTPIGELPKDHFWIDRDNHLCCGQIHTRFKVDVSEVFKREKD